VGTEALGEVALRPKGQRQFYSGLTPILNDKRRMLDSSTAFPPLDDKYVRPRVSTALEIAEGLVLGSLAGRRNMFMGSIWRT